MYRNGMKEILDSYRGPLRVLWVVEVTTSECSNGDGITPAPTSPDIWDISAIIRAFTSLHI